MKTGKPNKSVERNRRPGSPCGAWQDIDNSACDPSPWSAAVAHLFRSIRMTRHASGWFGRLREPCCGYAAEEATVSGAHSGHGQEGPPMSRMIATAGPYRRSDLSTPISVIRSQKQSGSNQPLEPTETSSRRGSIIKVASRVSPCLRGSAHRSTMIHDVDMSASHHGGLRPKGFLDHGFRGWPGWDRTGARTPWHPCNPCDPWSSSLHGAPQIMRSSNQPHEPTETSSCRSSIFKGASRVSPCLRGSAHR
jgi:hypothetical protein